MTIESIYIMHLYNKNCFRRPPRSRRSPPTRRHCTFRLVQLAPSSASSPSPRRLTVSAFHHGDIIPDLLVGLSGLEFSHGSITSQVNMLGPFLFKDLVDLFKCQALSLDPIPKLPVKDCSIKRGLTIRRNVTTFQLALMMYIRQPMVANPIGMT